MRVEQDGYVSLRFPAAVTDPAAPAEVYVEIRFKEYDVTSLDIRLGVIGDDRNHRIRVYSELMHPEWNYFWLYAKPPHTRSVEVLGLRGIGGEGGGSDELHAVIPRASAIAVGIPTVAYGAETKVSFSADLTPSGILQGVGSLTFMGDGSIRRRELEKGEIVVTIGGGNLRAREWYDTTEADEFGNSVTKLVQRAILSGEVVVPAGISLTTAQATLQEELSDICTVLSLCYRVSVNYYQITYHETPDDAPITESFLRRRIPRVAKRPVGRDELINFRALRQGGLDTLVRSFRGAEAKEEIASAIHFLASSYGTDSLEAAYFLAFSGLEAAVGAAEGRTAYALGAARWERLEKELEAAIGGFVDREYKDEEERAEVKSLLIAKLPDVRRISIRRRVETVCRDRGVQTEDLWPTVVGFDAGFGRATANRNALFHAAAVNDAAMNDDIIRLCVLAERLILRLLGWPDEDIWKWYDQELRWLNRRDPPSA